MAASSLNVKRVIKSLQDTAEQLRARRQEAERSIKKAEQELEKAQMQQAEVTTAIAQFEQQVGMPLAKLLVPSHRSRLDGELDQFIAGFRGSDDPFTAADVRSTLMARERLSPAEMSTDRVRRLLASLVRRGVVQRLPRTGPGRLSQFVVSARKRHHARHQRGQRKGSRGNKAQGGERTNKNE